MNRIAPAPRVFLIDTNIVSEARKQAKANQGVTSFFNRATASGQRLYLAVIALGEVRRGAELVRHRGDTVQADRLDTWLKAVTEQYAGRISPFDGSAAQVWGRLRVPDPAHEIDKQIAAIALVDDLILVTRNTADFRGLGVRLENPFRLP